VDRRWLGTTDGDVMQAIVCERYGPPDVLELREVAKPAAGDDHVLVRVRAASVNPYDAHAMRGRPLLFRLDAGIVRPKAQVLGVDVAGEVEAVGSKVQMFQPGDAVFGGVSSGAFAEYVRTREQALVAKPANLSFEQAASVPGAAFTALQGLRDGGRIRAGQKVLIIGASGGVGTFAVQIAKHFGAEVTGVCSTRNLDMVRSLGADHVVDYTQEDFATVGPRYDLVLDAVGNRSLAACRRALRSGGVYVALTGPDGLLLGPAGRWLKILLMSRLVRQEIRFLLAKPDRGDLVALAEMLEAGHVTPVIDRTYPLPETPDAIRYLERGHARGKVVISI
jgi:NADPH:quinone reductase-like Zn-dependent oxidoreductase